METDSINAACKYCSDGLEPQLIDENGTLSWISGRAGTLCHAYDDAWWPCLRATQLIAVTPSMRSELDKAGSIRCGCETPDLHDAMPEACPNKIKLMWVKL